jgi:hypothetical protein
VTPLASLGTISNLHAFRDGRWRLIVNPLVEHTRSVVPGEDPAGGWQPPKEGIARKYIWFLRGYWRDCAARPPVELFDTETDPGCNTNLADDPAQQERRAALEAALTDWEKRTKDTFREEATLAKSRATIDGIVADVFRQ